MNNTSSSRFRLLVSLSIIAIVVFGYIAFILLMGNRSDGIAVEVRFLPEDAEVMVNSENVKNDSIKRLGAGEYTVTAQRDGFIDYEQVFTINSQNSFIDFAMTPESEEAFEYIAQNNELYLDFEDRSGERAVLDGERFRDINPIVLELPYETFFFTIGYRVDPQDPNQENIIIEIDAGEGYKNPALQQIRNWGYDPTTLNINFINHRNPFDE